MCIHSTRARLLAWRLVAHVTFTVNSQYTGLALSLTPAWRPLDFDCELAVLMRDGSELGCCTMVGSCQAPDFIVNLQYTPCSCSVPLGSLLGLGC